MKKIFPLLLSMLILMVSVGYLVPRTRTEASPEITASSTAYAPERESNTAPAVVSESEATISTTDTTEKESLDAEETKSTTLNETEASQEEIHVTGNPSPTVPVPTQTLPVSDKKPPKQTEPPKETQPPATETPTQPSTPTTAEQPTEPVVTEPKPTAPPDPQPKETEATEPQFDIGYWIGYAKSYAVSAGLRLEPSAVNCWDNPIRAGSHCTYLERDIQSRLNRYATDEDITDVWIWAESRGDGTYDLYIGYA